MNAAYRFFALLVLATAPVANALAQCAMCAATVESNAKTGSTVGKGLNTGILYLMVIPYLLFGTVGYLWYKNAKMKSAAAPKRRPLPPRA